MHYAECTCKVNIQMDPNSHFSAGKFMDIILMRRSALYNPSIFNIFYRFLFSRIRIWIRFDFLSLRASGSGLSMKSRLEQAIDCAEKLKWDANHTKYMNIIQYSQTKKKPNIASCFQNWTTDFEFRKRILWIHSPVSISHFRIVWFRFIQKFQIDSNSICREHKMYRSSNESFSFSIVSEVNLSWIQKKLITWMICCKIYTLDLSNKLQNSNHSHWKLITNECFFRSLARKKISATYVLGVIPWEISFSFIYIFSHVIPTNTACERDIGKESLKICTIWLCKKILFESWYELIRKLYFQ